MSGERLPVLGGACEPDGTSSSVELESAQAYASSEFAGNVLMVTLGCAKNLVDSEVMLGALRGRGFRPIAEPEEADLIVVNTCAFLQSAVEEGIDRILELGEYKESGRCRRLIVAGCMVERYRAELCEALPEVDQFISTDELLEIGKEKDTSEACFREARRPYFLYDESMPRMRSTLGHTAFIKVAEGCNRPCTFCIIPKLRGGFRSRPIDSICEEAERLLEDGVREINLVAQDLTAYGTDFEGGRGIKSQLPNLLERLSSLSSPSEEFWVRLLYAYPIGVTEELLRQIRDLPNICNYLDLPLQHISKSVLKAMQRPLGEKGTRALVEQMRTLTPEISLRTTFIVGFPGETEEDVDRLEAFVAEGHFTHVGVFTYSQEKEAASFTLPDQIDDEVKEARRARVMEAQRTLVEQRGERLIGSRCTVLFEGLHEESDLLYSARASWQAPETDGGIIVNELDDSLEGVSLDSMIGRFAELEFTEAAGYDLVGTLKALL